MLFYNIFHIVYCILYLYLHTMNNGKVSQDLLLYHLPIQPWTKRLYHEIFTVCNHEKEAVSRDILLYPAPVYVYYVYVDNYCNITCWLLFQLCFVFCSKPSYHHKHGCLVWNIKLVSLQVRIYTLLQNTIEDAASKWCYSSYQHKHSIHRCRIQ